MISAGREAVERTDLMMTGNEAIMALASVILRRRRSQSPQIDNAAQVLASSRNGVTTAPPERSLTSWYMAARRLRLRSLRLAASYA